MDSETQLIALRTLLPILWAIVSTVIGLLLYKTSAAFFEQKDQIAGRTRRIRLVGSVVIAGLAFLGLRQSTPTELLLGRGADSALVSAKSLGQLEESIEQAQADANELKACAALAPPRQCEMELRRLDAALDQVTARKAQLKEE